MKKIVLMGLVAISCAMARDCRYEEERLNDLIWQYNDVQSQFAEIDLREQQAKVEDRNRFIQNLARIRLGDKDGFSKMSDYALQHRFNQGTNIPREFQNQRDLLQKRQLKLNQRIKQAKQQLNNCRRKK